MMMMTHRDDQTDQSPADRVTAKRWVTSRHVFRGVLFTGVLIAVVVGSLALQPQADQFETIFAIARGLVVGSLIGLALAAQIPLRGGTGG